MRNTVQAQAQQQAKKVDTRSTQRTNKIEKKPTQYQQILDTYKQRAGVNKNESLSKNISESMFGKTSLTNAAANVITGNADKNLKPYTKEQETEARELAQMAKESYNRKAKEDGSSKLAQEMFGNPFDDEDAYKQYLPKYYDDNAIARTVQGIGAGGQNFLKGLAGNKLKQADEQTRLDTKEENVEDALAEAEFLDRLTGESMGRTPQSMYDRLVMNAVSNGLSNLQTSALISAAGLPVGGKLARGVGLANMANNSYGNAYADVRLGNKGEQYANDIDAANRYALANAGNELAQEALSR